MKTLAETSEQLRAALTRLNLTQAELKAMAGISGRTLTNVLSGKEDFKLSTLLALADRLGLELLLVPKGAANAVNAVNEYAGSDESAAPAVKSKVQAALDRIASANDTMRDAE